MLLRYSNKTYARANVEQLKLRMAARFEKFTAQETSLAVRGT